MPPLFNGEKYIEKWAPVRDGIKRYILSEGYNHEVEAFVQTPHSSELDASVLTFPFLGIVDAIDPRMLSTTEKIRKRLSIGELVYRYTGDDNLEGQEGAFVLCSFWLIENLAMTGLLQEAC